MEKRSDNLVYDFKSFNSTVSKILDGIGADEIFRSQDKILIKPNLVTSSPHPVTTPSIFCEAVINYIRKVSEAELVVAEGSGEPGKNSLEIFQDLGFSFLSRKYGVKLVDLNLEQPIRYFRTDCKCFPEMHLPEIAFTHFIVSLPVLKAHSLAKITGSMKNMIGFAPPLHYSGSHGSWKKASFHGSLQESIIDLNRYRTPDLTIMDASIGLAEFHLGGPRCDPPVGKMIAGADPKAVDRKAAEYLGLDWKTIEHLN